MVKLELQEKEVESRFRGNNLVGKTRCELEVPNGGANASTPSNYVRYCHSWGREVTVLWRSDTAEGVIYGTGATLLATYTNCALE